jgi:hypothetical protein
MTTADRTPSGFGATGKRLWRDTLAAYTLDPAEHELLLAACRSLTELERIERTLVKEPLMVTGSTGHAVPHPLLAEARAQVRRSRACCVGWPCLSRVRRRAGSVRRLLATRPERAGAAMSGSLSAC